MVKKTEKPGKPNKSNHWWLKEHFTDPYVIQAQKEGYRSRAVYKLLELNERCRLFKPGMTVVDLGAAPGGWSQVVVKLVKPNGRVVAMDILPMDPIEGVDFIQGDFSEDAVLQTLLDHLVPDKSSTAVADWVISDLAPNMSGHEGVDIPRSMYFAELILDFALQVLKPEGGFLIKVFQGEGIDQYMAMLKQRFKNVSIRKPKASRGRSREVYVLARELRVK